MRCRRRRRRCCRSGGAFVSIPFIGCAHVMMYTDLYVSISLEVFDNHSG
jgi:hypothetical protein